MEDAWLYLDNNATTPCDPRVVEKMLPFFREIYGNPANGLHRQGRKARQAVDDAREQVAALVGARPEEVVFTTGATESNNLTILGLARSEEYSDRTRIVTSSVEHKCVLGAARKLQEIGFEWVQLPVDRHGRVNLDVAREVINANTLVVSVQLANNEVGTIQPVPTLAELAHENGAFFHCDAAQAVGKIPVDVDICRVDFLSMSAHKLYGPKGIGALYIRGGANRIALEPLSYGGGQENGLRPGTLNVPGMVGFGEACRIAHDVLPEEKERIAGLRNQLEIGLNEAIPTLQVNARMADRLPNTSSLIYEGVEADALILNLETVMVGTGSACSSGAIEPSHVLIAMGLSREQAYGTVRVSLGRFSDHEGIAVALKEFISAYQQLHG